MLSAPFSNSSSSVLSPLAALFFLSCLPAGLGLFLSLAATAAALLHFGFLIFRPPFRPPSQLRSQRLRYLRPCSWTRASPRCRLPLPTQHCTSPPQRHLHRRLCLHLLRCLAHLAPSFLPRLLRCFSFTSLAAQNLLSALRSPACFMNVVCLMHCWSSSPLLRSTLWHLLSASHQLISLWQSAWRATLWGPMHMLRTLQADPSPAA